MAEVFANPLAELAEYTDMKQDMDKRKRSDPGQRRDGFPESSCHA